MPESPAAALAAVEDTPNSWVELQACLDVLAELADHYADPYGHKLPDLDEQLTAFWQTVELTLALGAENDAAWQAVNGLRVLVNELQGQVAEDRRIWRPGL